LAYIIGIDGGTESLRAHVFDLTGKSLGSGVGRYQTSFPSPGRAEQAPMDWWAALGVAVRTAVLEAKVPAQEIASLCLDTTSCTVVALDENGQPLRPAILWMDVRAEKEAEAVLATGDAALSLNGAGHGPVSAEWMIPKALWLKRHEPALYQQAKTICEYQDFLMHRLTGRLVASLTNVAMRWHYRKNSGGWPLSLLEALDLADLFAKWPQEIVAPGSLVGNLTPEAAAHLKLPRATKVIQGGADAFIGMIGLGVAKPGQVALITGSSHLQLAVCRHELLVPGLWGSYADVVYPGCHVLEGGQTSSGSMIAWLDRLLGKDYDFDRLNREASAIAPGSDGLVALDHFQGNRNPYTDAASRGALVGLTLGHGPAHIFRAMIESICLGTRLILDRMRAAGVPLSELIVGGGASHSPLWLQIHADTANLPVKVATCTDAPALGSAILAAVGAGFFPDVQAGIAAMTSIDRTISPNPAAVASYEALLARYVTLYQALKAWRSAF
jgi:ribulokinase